MRKLNKVTTVKNDTIETYDRCTYACGSCGSPSCDCRYKPSAEQTTKANNRYSANMRKFNGTYKK
ncbi:hypothetical protein [Ruminococcus flavefaciens]|uniref:hypothetical protein n=1 Tax=Ruminococcus flavefaciens TaxID=1265 RepID=UPI0026F2C816|nr:hypothetical protein [Ruminococcus flavefaciens]